MKNVTNLIKTFFLYYYPANKISFLMSFNDFNKYILDFGVSINMKIIFSLIPIVVVTGCALSEPRGYYQDPVVKDNRVEQWQQWETEQRIKADMRYMKNMEQAVKNRQ
jgi:hypothetical protein